MGTTKLNRFDLYDGLNSQNVRDFIDNIFTWVSCPWCTRKVSISTNESCIRVRCICGGNFVVINDDINCGSCDFKVYCLGCFVVRPWMKRLESA